MIRSENRRAGFRSDFAVAASATTGVEDFFTSQLGKLEPGLRFESRSVFVVVSDFVPVPLKSETGKMLLLDETRNAVNDRVSNRALVARDRFGRHRQRR